MDKYLLDAVQDSNRYDFQLEDKFGDENLIFLISMPRSGSTLLQKMLGNSLEICTTSEPWLLLPFLGLHDHNLVKSLYRHDLALTAIQIFLADSSIKEEEYVATLKKFFLSIYRQSLQNKKTHARFFMDKTPRYVYILSKIYKYFPESKYIFLLRDPIAIICSYATTWFYSQFSQILEDEYCMRDFEVGMKCLAAGLNNRPKNSYILSYEDLVTKPKHTMKDISKFLSIEYSKKMVQYGSRKGSISRYKFGDIGSVYQKSVPDPSHCEKWKNILSRSGQKPDFLKILEKIDARTLATLGYSKESLKLRLEQV